MCGSKFCDMNQANSKCKSWKEEKFHHKPYFLYSTKFPNFPLVHWLDQIQFQIAVAWSTKAWKATTRCLIHS